MTTQQPGTPNGAALSLASAPQDGTLSVYSSERAFAAGQRIAQSLAASTLVPKSFQGNVANCMIAIELAGRIGCSVFMVMQNLDVIHGRPGLRAQFLIATVNTSGRFTPLRFRFEGEQGKDSWGCRAYAKDKSTGEECVGTLITIGIAKAEGWYQRDGSKWKTIPEQMLQYRSAAFWTRVFCPETSMGMQTTEEVIDTVGYEVVDTGAPQAPTAAPEPPPQAAPARDWEAEAEALRQRVAAATVDDIALVKADIRLYAEAGAPKPLADELKKLWSAASKAPKPAAPPSDPQPPPDDGGQP